MEPLVSIIVPVYNGAPYLDRCLESILTQTYHNWELILIDDGSTDDSLSICRRYEAEDGRIQVIHQENHGVSHARNVGVARSKGAYLSFVDCDDSLVPEAVAIMVGDAIRYEADVVSCMEHTVDEKGAVPLSETDGRIQVYRGLEALCLHLDRDRNAEALHAKLFGRAFVADLPFVEGRKINEDGYYLFQCYEREPVLVQHNVAIYEYYMTVGSASRSPFSEKYLDMLYFCQEKERTLRASHPELLDRFRNKEVETRILFLAVLFRAPNRVCGKERQECIQRIRQYAHHFTPATRFERIMVTSIRLGLYQWVKWFVIVRGKFCSR